MTGNAQRPYHINASPGDLTNRFIFLCGSDERAKRIASHFSALKIQESSRGHHLYLGEIESNQKSIPVASISTGMGCPSEDIILNELYLSGGRTFLRVGTAGSLQPDKIKVGDLVVATAAVRDEDTSASYIMPEFPAVASREMINAIENAAKALNMSDSLYYGIVHTKSSFYAREMFHSLLPENQNYLEILKKAGVLATEMECSLLFILSSLYSHRTPNFHHPAICAGAILAIVGDSEPIDQNMNKKEAGIEKAIQLALSTAKIYQQLVNL